jgi:hypothetical protein
LFDKKDPLSGQAEKFLVKKETRNDKAARPCPW